MEAFQKIRLTYETEGRRFARHIARSVFGWLHISPNVVTVGGTLLNAVAAWYLFNEHFITAAIIFLVGSLLDAMDGAIANVTGRVTRFGGFLDSTLDRVSEGFVLTGLGLMFATTSDDPLLPLGACFVALAGSYLVSYTRAKAEAIGVECKVGLASRAERVVVLTAGMLLAAAWPVALEVTAYVLAATATLTVVQRILHVARCLALDDRSAAETPPRG